MRGATEVDVRYAIVSLVLKPCLGYLFELRCRARSAWTSRWAAAG